MGRDVLFQRGHVKKLLDGGLDEPATIGRHRL